MSTRTKKLMAIMVDPPVHKAIKLQATAKGMTIAAYMEHLAEKNANTEVQQAIKANTDTDKKATA